MKQLDFFDSCEMAIGGLIAILQKSRNNLTHRTTSGRDGLWSMVIVGKELMN